MQHHNGFTEFHFIVMRARLKYVRVKTSQWNAVKCVYLWQLLCVCLKINRQWMTWQTKWKRKQKHGQYGHATGSHTTSILVWWCKPNRWNINHHRLFAAKRTKHELKNKWWSSVRVIKICLALLVTKWNIVCDTRPFICYKI